MRLCFILEEQYRRDSMPMVVAKQLLHWGHSIDVLEPPAAVTCLSDLASETHDAFVLKTVSGGPGLSILQAAEAVGIPTINNARSISLVRDKTIATAFAHARGLRVPRTYFMSHPRLLKEIPGRDYPLVVKPTDGSSGRGIYRVSSPADLATLEIDEPAARFFLAQHYVENAGVDIKLYVIGKRVYSVTRKSPLHPEVEVEEGLVPPTLEWRRVAWRVGEIFGLEIYGVDVIETSEGPVVVDINDFPGFGGVPGAVSDVSSYIIHIAERAKLRRRRNAVSGPSGINPIEPWSSTVPETHPGRGVQRGPGELEGTLRRDAATTKARRTAFRWTRTGDEVLARIARFCQRISDSGRSPGREDER